MLLQVQQERMEGKQIRSLKLIQCMMVLDVGEFFKVLGSFSISPKKYAGLAGVVYSYL